MLHGEIKVNDVVIGTWTAARTNSKINNFGEYDCHVTYRDTQGYPCEARWRMVGQAHSNGALSLAARVLMEAGAHIQRKRVDND